MITPVKYEPLYVNNSHSPRSMDPHNCSSETTVDNRELGKFTHDREGQFEALKNELEKNCPQNIPFEDVIKTAMKRCARMAHVCGDSLQRKFQCLKLEPSRRKFLLYIPKKCEYISSSSVASSCKFSSVPKRGGQRGVQKEPSQARPHHHLCVLFVKYFF